MSENNCYFATDDAGDFNNHKTPKDLAQDAAGLAVKVIADLKDENELVKHERNLLSNRLAEVDEHHPEYRVKFKEMEAENERLKEKLASHKYGSEEANELREENERLKLIYGGNLASLQAELKAAQERVRELQAGIHGYIADAKTAKNACRELISIQSEQARLLKAAQERLAVSQQAVTDCCIKYDALYEQLVLSIRLEKQKQERLEKAEGLLRSIRNIGLSKHSINAYFAEGSAQQIRQDPEK